MKLYFDPQSGLLVRMLRYTDTALGLNPAQVDFSDYRALGNVKTPYRWTIARPGGAFTIQTMTRSTIRPSIPRDLKNQRLPAKRAWRQHRTDDESSHISRFSERRSKAFRTQKHA